MLEARASAGQENTMSFFADMDSLILLAATARRSDVGNWLLTYRDVNSAHTAGWTPLHWAAAEGRADVADWLLTLPGASADVKADNGWTPLHLASRWGHAEVVTSLLAHQADANVKSKSNRYTPLHEAAKSGCADVVRLLLAHQADVDARTIEGCTPLYLAADHEDVAELLRQHHGHSYGLEALARVSVVSKAGTVSRFGGGYRFQVRVEGANESNCLLGWSGVTINVPTIDSRERYLKTEVQMLSYGCSPPVQHGPGDLIWGFRDDGSFGEKVATCLFMESVREQWPPHERIALEAVLFAPHRRLDLQVRVWSNRPEAGVAFGEPDWNTTRQQKDQQGIPAYAISLTFDAGALGAAVNFLRRFFDRSRPVPPASSGVPASPSAAAKANNVIDDVYRSFGSDVSFTVVYDYAARESNTGHQDLAAELFNRVYAHLKQHGGSEETKLLSAFAHALCATRATGTWPVSRAHFPAEIADRFCEARNRFVAMAIVAHSNRKRIAAVAGGDTSGFELRIRGSPHTLKVQGDGGTAEVIISPATSDSQMQSLVEQARQFQVTIPCMFMTLGAESWW